jgi:hypothetical protein
MPGNISFKSQRGRQRFLRNKGVPFGPFFIYSIQPEPYSSYHGRRGTLAPANRFSFSGTKGLSFFFPAYIAWTNSR